MTEITLPLSRLFIDVLFRLYESSEQALKNLRKAIVENPVLMTPNLRLNFHLFIDTSDFAKDSVLVREEKTRSCELFTSKARS